MRLASNIKSRYRLVSIITAAIVATFPIGYAKEQNPVKLYWFIPDGMRAEPERFDIYKWAMNEELPNLRKLMQEGAYGYSLPDFPSHTPTNFASLLTGSRPDVHGIADGPMHIEGAPLSNPSSAGFSSVTKRVPPVWEIMDHEKRSTVLLSIPGSTPPESDGITIRGRWGGWGVDTYNVIFESASRLPDKKKYGRAFRLFYLGSPLTRFVPLSPATQWLVEGSGAKWKREATLSAHGLDLHAFVYSVSNSPDAQFERLAIFFDKQEVVATLQTGQWTDWIPATLNYRGIRLDSHVKLKLIKLEPDGDFRVRVLYNNLNSLVTEPPEVAEALTREVGPMVDFPDNWPPQLVFEQEDKRTFLEEMKMALNWHRKAVSAIYKLYDPDVFIQDTYTPNQMLESRWWLREIEGNSSDVSSVAYKTAWRDVLSLYKGLDSILGEAITHADENTLIVLSSDHGVCPLKRLVKLNNLFAKRGWLKFRMDPETGEPIIDWDQTKVIYLKMAHVYVNPNGLAGDWIRSRGDVYDALRQEVISTIEDLEDGDGGKPLVRAVKWEDAGRIFHLPHDRVGDIVLEVRPPYFWFEEVDNSLDIFADSVTSGYKQTIDPVANKCMWTPFVIWGPGVRQGFQLDSPIHHRDQLPTILTLMGIEVPEYIQGRVIKEIMAGRFERTSTLVSPDRDLASSPRSPMQ